MKEQKVRLMMAPPGPPIEETVALARLPRTMREVPRTQGRPMVPEVTTAVTELMTTGAETLEPEETGMLAEESPAEAAPMQEAM